MKMVEHHIQNIFQNLPKVEIKNFNLKIDGKNYVNNDIRTYENIRNTATSQGDNYTTGCLLDYLYFRKEL